MGMTLLVPLSGPSWSFKGSQRHQEKLAIFGTSQNDQLNFSTILKPLEGVVFADCGTDLGSAPSVPGDPAGARLKPGNGYGYGVGVRLESPFGPLRLEYAFNDHGTGRFHFGVGYRN